MDKDNQGFCVRDMETRIFSIEKKMSKERIW